MTNLQRNNRVNLALFCIIAVAVLAPPTVGAGGRRERGPESELSVGDGRQIDYLGVAAVMIRDGNYDRAQRALDQVDLESEDTDLVRYYTLSGLLSLRQGDYLGATTALESAVDLGQTDPLINVYLAQAYYASQEYRAAIDTIARVPNLVQFSGLYSVLAESHWRLGNTEQAYRTVSRALELFPTQIQFLRQRILYLIELNLTQEAAEQSLEYLAHLEEDPDAYVTIGEALRRGGNAEPAIRTLEMARLRFPGDQRVYLALAQAYLDAGQMRSAGTMVERAAASNFALYYEAAEIFRRAREYDRALFLNSMVIDELKKTTQRFSVLLSMARFEEALALVPRMERLGALDDDNLVYGVAYAYFETRQLEKATVYVNRIDTADLFRQATQLRRAIETVRDSDGANAS